MSVDLWTPSAADAPVAQGRNQTWFIAIGRMKPGVTVTQARADMGAVQSQLGKQFPKTDADMTAEVQPLKQVVLNGSANSLWLVYGSVSLLLVIACMNVAALLLARTTQREHEIAVRFSLGASRKKIIGQLLSEVFALAVAGALPRQIGARFLLQGLRVTAIGCAAGLLLGVGLGRWLMGMLYGVSPLDPVTYAGMLMLILLVAALASLAPAMRAARVQPTEVLREE